jgi:hypothetical protein
MKYLTFFASLLLMGIKIYGEKDYNKSRFFLSQVVHHKGFSPLKTLVGHIDMHLFHFFMDFNGWLVT